MSAPGPNPPGPILVPAGLEERRLLGPDWADWLDRLPRTASDLLSDWDCRFDDRVWHGHCSLVLAVRGPDGGPAVIKISFDGDDESEYEHLALQRWAGQGTVRMLRADPSRRALLLERLGPADLHDSWDLEACEIVGGLYGRIHRPAMPQLRPVADYVRRWSAALERMPRDAPIPHRLVSQTVGLARDLTADPATATVIVHGDLHYANVLAGEREPWLVIDPKPMRGDPHYEPAPMLWNRMDELAGDVRDGLRRRFHTLIDTAGLDEDRARDWVIVRVVLNAHWTVDDAVRQGRALSRRDQEWITRMITVAKAVQE